MNNQLLEYLEFATETAFMAGRLTLGHYQTGIRPEFKEDESSVTISDREAESLICQRIEKRYPRHSIVGEEYGESAQMR
ncbi:MAG: hypothetical protein P1S60_15480 [Anaerolineae bacterium]|nr:hypothetical protein [Anaerolineae bacterium]